MENWQIISGLANRLGAAFTYTSAREIASEIRAAIPAYDKTRSGSFWEQAIFEKRFMTPNGKGRFSVLKIDLSPRSVEKKQYVSSENYFQANIRGRLVSRA